MVGSGLLELLSTMLLTKLLRLDINSCPNPGIKIDGTGQDLRAKSRTLDYVLTKPEKLPVWNYDGSSTYQSQGENSDTFLYPVAIFNDPFRLAPNNLVMCEAYKHDHTPADTNHRKSAIETMTKAADQNSWFGIEQEYTLLDTDCQPFAMAKDWLPRSSEIIEIDAVMIGRSKTLFKMNTLDKQGHKPIIT